MSDARLRILSLDGGGVRGLMTAVWLERLEERLGAPLHQHFDVIAGSSSGALIACAVALGKPASELVATLRTRAREVFPSTPDRLWSRARRSFREGLSAPRYAASGLERVLRELFREAKLGDLRAPATLVTAYDTLARRAVVFKSTKPSHRELALWEVCKASASAPAYFPAHVMVLEGARVPLVDGGVVANNPTVCAIAEGLALQKQRPAAQRIPLERFCVVSVGTGESTRSIPAEDAQSWGALEWAIPVIDVLFDGSSDAVDYAARQMLSEGRYWRVQTRLDAAYDDLDNADETNLNALIVLANGYLAAGGEAQLQAVARALR